MVEHVITSITGNVAVQHTERFDQPAPSHVDSACTAVFIAATSQQIRPASTLYARPLIHMEPQSSISVKTLGSPARKI